MPRTPATWEAEAEGARVQGQPGQLSGEPLVVGLQPMLPCSQPQEGRPHGLLEALSVQLPSTVPALPLPGVTAGLC